MPSLETARKVSSVKYNNTKTLGQIYKGDSDFFMETTWENDIQSKICYIYDYWHDDQLNKKDNMTYENTTKTQIDAKFIVKSYQSIDKDQVEYYLQFKPSQKTQFTENDELYYFETDYRQKYNNDDFVGMYCDIPDDNGVYHKWLIYRKEIGNQFVKYLILPINYQFMWVEKINQQRIKRKMWGVLRNQNSYTIGVYTDRTFTRPDNQNKVILPLNSITEKIWYTNGDLTNMRVIVSALTKHPIVWKVTKISNSLPLGLQILTLYQDRFNEHTDYVDFETGEMYADYFEVNTQPIESIVPDINDSIPSLIAKINTATNYIKVGGSYKTLTINLYDNISNDITDTYSNSVFNWRCSINNEDWTDNVTWKESKYNQMKIKFPTDRTQLGKSLNVKCTIINGTEIIETEIVQFNIIE